MNTTAIIAKGIGKQYLVQSRKSKADTLTETATNGLKRLLTGLGKACLRMPYAGSITAQEFWALRDVSFELQKGEALGIIGCNGSGKSTLLKVLSRITPPSEGEAFITGRLGSLLEVGTGFHQELTGRENTFLSGTILGMKKLEITARFDEIVAFSGVEKFIDTPVKYYSSGMYLRLAFAVAAHLSSEILLIDEVLAVGDITFQRKCIEKMSQLVNEGRTVLFVSHNLGAVSRLCSSGLLLDKGKVITQGPISDVIATYGRNVAAQEEEKAQNRIDRITLYKLKTEPVSSLLDPSTPITFNFRINIQKVYWDMFIQLIITWPEEPEGLKLVLDSVDSERLPQLLQLGRYEIKIFMPTLWLRPGIYSSRIKVVAQPEMGETERFYSETTEIIIESGASCESISNRILTPRTDWHIRTVAH